MIDRLTTEDKKGNTYEKIRLVGTGDAVVCVNGTNKHFRGQPNVSIRTGPSVFGKEVVIQLDCSELLEEYNSSSGFEKHVEIYLKEDEAKELFKNLLKMMGVQIDVAPAGKPVKNICHMCGNGHLYCEKCKSYTWHHELEGGEKDG